MDARFKFRLEKVLEIKIQRENEHMISHSKILNEKNKVENEIKNLESQYDKYSEIQYLESDTLKKKIAYNYMNSLFQTIQRYREELEEIEKRYAESRDILITLQSERKSLDRLKEKQYCKFLEELEEEENILNDEFSIQAYFRNSKE